MKGSLVEGLTRKFKTRITDMTKSNKPPGDSLTFLQSWLILQCN
jgi:hypothetical protein